MTNCKTCGHRFGAPPKGRFYVYKPAAESDSYYRMVIDHDIVICLECAAKEPEKYSGAQYEWEIYERDRENERKQRQASSLINEWIQEWQDLGTMDITLDDLQALKAMVVEVEETAIEYYWQSSSAHC